MSKLANPWKCDNAACGKLRESDANHWWLIGRQEHSGGPYIVISPWDTQAADAAGVKHGCGIDCALKIAARAMDEMVFTAPAAKDVQSD